MRTGVVETAILTAMEVRGTGFAELFEAGTFLLADPFCLAFLANKHAQ
jgi:hypothetical protein